MIEKTLQIENGTEDTFRQDVIAGLTAPRKHLFSKYLYDKRGDKLFQKIMDAEQYYLTDAELEIFNTRCAEMVQVARRFAGPFDLVELGAGDALKSRELLKCFVEKSIDFTYYPTDISENMVKLVERELPLKIKNLKIKGISGEYFSALSQVKKSSTNPKFILFLGGNIGNMPPEEALDFCRELRTYLKKGDLVLIGFDLRKNPWTVFNAYNDKDGITREFNLNLLRRINTELGADFEIKQFEHYESYDPETGACNSYLFSLSKQTAHIAETEINFEENELIFMETSHKYSIEETDELALKAGFKPLTQLFDSKKWFSDVIWELV